MRLSYLKCYRQKNEWDYYKALKEFAALLKDVHIDIQEPYSLYYYSRYKFIDIRNVNHHFFVVNIERKDSAKLPLGSELLTIHGLPLLKYLQTEMFPYICASTEQQLWNDAARYMAYATNTTTT